MAKELAVKTHKIPEFIMKQSAHSHLPRLPARFIACGPSASGKSVLLVDMLLRLYRGCFARIYVFSPSCGGLDKTWDPLIKYCENELGCKKEECFFSEWNEGTLAKIVEDQSKITAYAKGAKHTHLHQIAVCVDDWADRRDVCHRPDNILSTLYIRGRHAAISTFLGVQRWCLADPVCRAQATSLAIFRLKSNKDLSMICDELGALFDPETIREIYKTAVDDRPYSFLYVDLTAHKKDDMFYLRFDGGKLMAEDTH